MPLPIETSMGYLRLFWLPKFFCYWCCCYCGCGCCSGCPTTALTACHPMPPLLLPPSPSSSAFFLAADNQQLPRPFANFHRRPVENNHKDMDKYKYRDIEKCKIRQSTASIPKVKLKREMSSSGKKLSDVQWAQSFESLQEHQRYLQRFFSNILLSSDNAARWCSPALQTRQGSVNSNAPHYEYSPLGVISCAWQVDLWKL